VSSLQLLAALAAAAVGGLIAQRYQVPGGLILGSMIGAAAVTLLTGGAISIPRPLQASAFIVIGASIGILITRESLVLLRPVLLPAVLGAVLIIIAGLGISYLLRALGLAPPGDLLATSPGALSVMSSMAVEQGTGVVEVALFHLVRVVLVILSLPLLVHLLRGGS
jgi:uncharacterized protein